jgi:type VI secretion system secreted protein Hcp
MRKLFLIALLCGATYATPSCPVWVGQASPYPIGTIVVHGTQSFKVTRSLDNGWIEPTNSWFWTPTTETCTPAPTPAPVPTPSPANGSKVFPDIPAYIEVDGIPGGVNVAGREGTIEAYEIDHRIYLPTDRDDGSITGTRKHDAFSFVKRRDRSSPLLLQRVATGESISKVSIKFYEITDQGEEVPSYQIELTKVKVVSVTKFNTPRGYAERVTLRYEKISETFLDGNLQFNDEWNSR